MPTMTPVADQVIPPNPQNGINTISGLLGLKQQQIGIQQQEQGLIAQTAEAQQAQQKNNELQQAQQLAMSVKNGSYRNPDGSLNRLKLSDDIAALGPYAEQTATQLISQANEMVANQQAHQNLNRSQQQQLGATFGALATKSDLTTSDFIDALNTLTESNDDPSFRRMAISMAASIPRNLNSVQLQDLARRWAIAGESPEGSAGASMPSGPVVQGPKGLQATNTNPLAPEGVGPIGTPIKQGITPQIATQPGTGGQFIVGPGAGATPVGGAPVGGAPAVGAGQGGGGTNWWQPQPGQVQFAQSQWAGVGQRAQVAQKYANTYPQTMDALTRARAILEQGGTATGGAFNTFKEIQSLLSSAHIDTGAATNMNELAKNLARYEAFRANSIGDTDAARSLTETSGPNVKLDSRAVKNVILQSMATEQELRGYANMMTNARDPQDALQKEKAFRSIPHLVQAYELGLMRNSGETDEFLKRYSVSGPELAKSAAMIRKLGAM